jgi:hypothetical protein
MRLPVIVPGILALALTAQAQAPATGSVSAPAPGAPAPQSGSVSMTPILPELDRLQSAASDTNAEISKLRIEKWKADAGSKQQAQSNAQSIQRNLGSALPGMISAVRSSPQDLGAEFRLYRNVNALYDVMSSLTESAGAFGPKSDYEGLARQLEVFDTARRNIGDALEQLSASTQSQLDQLRTQVHTLQASAAAAPPKKTVVDDSEPVKKTTTTHKAKPKKPASTASGSSTGQDASSPAANPSH